MSPRRPFGPTQISTVDCGGRGGVWRAGVQAADVSTEIPAIVHQTWKNASTLPPQLRPFVDAWRRLPEWRHMLHNDADNRALARRCGGAPSAAQPRISALQQQYDSFRVLIKRADMSRMLYLHRWGGVYADADVSACAVDGPKLRAALAPYALVLVRSPTGSVSNFFMASTRGHPFWAFALRRMPLVSGRAAGEGIGEFVLRSSGPHYLNATLAAFREAHPEQAARTKIFGVDEWQRATGAAHHWASTWLLHNKKLGRVRMKQPEDACGQLAMKRQKAWALPTAGARGAS